MTEQREIVAAEPPIDCRVMRIVRQLRERAERKWTDDASRSASLFGRAADELELLSTALENLELQAVDEIDRLLRVATRSHDMLLRGEDDDVILEMLQTAWRGPNDQK